VTNADSQGWSGTFTVPTGASYGFTVALIQADDGSWTGVINIPVQHATGLPLSEISVEPNAVSFRLAIEGRPPETASHWSLGVEGDAATGTIRQGPVNLTVEARRIPVQEALVRRPQTPQPPFPYAQREVRFDSTDGNATLAGTLTLPEGDGPHPAAILVSGSGAQNRDSEIFGHRSFLVIADHLTRAGVAVLRYDDRAFAESTGDPGGTTHDFLNDTAGALEFLTAQSEIDATRIGVIGHSEGGMIAPMLAARDERVAFVVMLAGPGVKFSELLLRQQVDVLGPGSTPEQLETLTAAARAVYAAMEAGEEIPDVHFRTMVQTQLEIAGVNSGGEALEVTMRSARAQLMLPWLQAVLSIDPATYLPSVRCPLLALNGTLDTQVAHEPNLAGIEAHVVSGGNQAVRTMALEGLNHLFQPATTGMPQEYPTIDTTFDAEALNILRDWILTVVNPE